MGYFMNQLKRRPNRQTWLRSGQLFHNTEISDQSNAVAKIVLVNWQQNISISLIIFLRRSRGMNMKWNESDWDQCFMTYVSLFLSKSYNASERAINYIPMTNDLAESVVFVQINLLYLIYIWTRNQTIVDHSELWYPDFEVNTLS